MGQSSFAECFTSNQEHYLEAGTIVLKEEGQKAVKITKWEHLKAPPIEDHIKGLTKIGPAPFIDKRHVQYGAIDIDVYPTNYKQLIAELKENNINKFILVKSTSGGAHVYFRFKEPTLAAAVQVALAEVAKIIGYEGSEVFPKQTMFDPVFKPEKNNGKGGWGGIGNAIYLPYGNDNSCVLDHEGNELTLDQFNNYWPTQIIDDVNLLPKPKQNRKITTSHVQIVSTERTKSHESYREALQKAPPCLQTLNSSIIPEGGQPGQGRNKGMFNFAVLMKKANGKADIESMRMFNEICSPKMDEGDLIKIIESVNGSDYFYSCNDEPIKSVCDKAVCKTKEYGIGQNQVDIETYPYTYIIKKDWVADNRDGQHYDMSHFQNILDAEKYYTEDGRLLDKKNYLRNNATDKVFEYGFHPGKPSRYKKEGKTIFNSYRKPKLEPVSGDIKPWLDVIEDMVPNKKYRGQLHSWIWHLINKPGVKMKWSPLVITPKGRGKDLMAQGLKPIVGIDYTAILDMKLFKQQHTGHLFKKVLGVVSETKETGKDRAAIMETLKPLITDLDLKVRQMHKDAFWVENVCNFIFFSNHKNALTLDMDNRRFMVLMDDKKRKPKEFYAPVWDLVENNPGVILNYYLNEFKPVDDFKPFADAPETEFLEEISENTDNPDFIVLDALYDQRMDPFNEESSYINITDIAEYLITKPGKYKFDIPTVKRWVQWRKQYGKAKHVGEINWYGKKMNIWTLDPDNETETDLSKIRSAYVRPYMGAGSMRRYDQEYDGKCCPKCNRPMNEREVISAKSPF